jgi:uncharacterized protein
MDGGNLKEMFAAACEGDLELLAYHVKNGVDINYAHPEFLSTPLVACILADQEKVAMYLLDQGAKPNLYSEFDGLRPIQAAIQMEQRQVTSRLIELGVVEPEPIVASNNLLDENLNRIKATFFWFKS